MKPLNYAVVSSICALIIGVMLVVWPDVAVNYLVITIGVLFLLPGLLGLFSYFAYAKKRAQQGVRFTFPIVALGSALLGLWLIIMPAFFVGILMYVLGVLLVLAGLNQLVNFTAVRSYFSVPVGMYVIPSLVLVAGLVVLFNPFDAATVPFVLLGVFSIVYSLTDLFRLLRFRRKQGEIEEVKEIDKSSDTTD